MENYSTYNQANNFDFIRIFAALLVLYSHHFALTGQLEPQFLGLTTFGGAAVFIFFSVSGYLVTSSWYNDPNFLRFSIKRILRIWPGLILVVLLSTFILGPVVSKIKFDEYFHDPITTFYLRWIWLKESYYLPGVFGGNPYKGAVNGSLWTIPLEVKCYVVIALLGALNVLKIKPLFFCLILLYLVWFFFKSSPDLGNQVRYSRQLGAYFLMGSALYLTEKIWINKKIIILIAIFAIGFALYKSGYKNTSLLLVIPSAVILFGVSSTPFLSKFGRYGDPSYGIYLFAFPVQQTTIMYMLPSINFYTSLFISGAVTIGLAYISWYLVEKQAIKLKPRSLKR